MVLTPIPEEALPAEQLQLILGPYLEELFNDPCPKDQPAAESAAETQEAEAVPEPADVSSHVALHSEGFQIC
ncbi:hypothetical protein KIL84_016846 [Mauremys mutica]|uniref:Uncharacterized protein n=1 Tax=Mauremys mutica TaxID=74926 RepID=A0A9D4AR48_9SAUR|nr:hypothetical protein KIL84_016846 [Mauremys mutica]